MKNLNGNLGAPRPVAEKLLLMTVQEFAKRVGLKLNCRTHHFLKRHKITSVGALLNTSVIHESTRTWLSLSKLREKLRDVGFENKLSGVGEYYFLIVPI